jgi:hypothetical protein
MIALDRTRLTGRLFIHALTVARSKSNTTLDIGGTAARQAPQMILDVRFGSLALARRQRRR